MNPSKAHEIKSKIAEKAIETIQAQIQQPENVEITSRVSPRFLAIKLLEKDEDAIIILNSLRKALSPDTPIVYLANKQDLTGARHAEVVKSQNYLREDSVIFPTNTLTGENLQEAGYAAD